MTLSDPNPSFKVTVYFKGEYLANGASNPLHEGFQGRRIEWRYFRFDNVQDGGWRPSWNDGTVARNPCDNWAFLFFSKSVHTLMHFIFTINARNNYALRHYELVSVKLN